MELHFDTKDNPKQKECAAAWLDNEVREIGYFGSKGAAKSYTGVSLIFGTAFTYPDTHYFIAREYLNDLRKYTHPSIYEVFEHWDIDEKYHSFNGQDNVWTLYNGSKIYYVEVRYQPRDPDFQRFGSQQYTRGWIEEAGQINFAAKRNLSAATGRWKNDEYGLVKKIILTGNPSQNFIYDMYKDWQKGTLKPRVKFIEASPEDNIMITKGYYDELRQDLSQAEQERLIDNNWEYSNDPKLLCSFDAIKDIFTNDFVKGTGIKSISADLAMQGRDRFIAGLWDGLVCNLKLGIDQALSDGPSIEKDLKELMVFGEVPRSRLVGDSDGLGNYLQGYLKGMKPFHANSSPEKPEFAKLKDECGYKLAELINKRKIKIICTPLQEERIIRELNVLKAESLDNKNKKKIINKDKMKDLLGHSPDYLDMLLMEMVFYINEIADLDDYEDVPEEEMTAQERIKRLLN